MKNILIILMFVAALVGGAQAQNACNFVEPDLSTYYTLTASDVITVYDGRIGRNITALTEQGRSNILNNDGKVIIPNKIGGSTLGKRVLRISTNAFDDAGLTSVVLPDAGNGSSTPPNLEVWPYAFKNNPNLKSVKLSTPSVVNGVSHTGGTLFKSTDNVTHIGGAEYAFAIADPSGTYSPYARWQWAANGHIVGGNSSMYGAETRVGKGWILTAPCPVFCNAGTNAPALSASTATTDCPNIIFDLTSIDATNAPNNSHVSLKWYTNSALTTAVATPAAADAGTYYAVFYDSENDCYSPSTPFEVFLDSDCDEVPDKDDLDDDNDGITDADEMNCGLQNFTNSDITVESSVSVENPNSSLGSDNSRAVLNATSDVLIIDLGAEAPASKAYIMEGFSTRNYSTATIRVESSNDPTTGFVLSDEFTNAQYANVDQTFNGSLNNVGRYLKFTVYNLAAGEEIHIDDIRHNGFSSNACADKDTDGDGIPNRLDLDSDNDGCADATEGGADLSASHVAGHGLSDGNGGLVTMNLPRPVGTSSTTNGIPTVAGTGQSVGTSEVKATVSAPVNLSSNSPVCANNNMKIYFTTDTEGAGWTYQLQKKNAPGIWENVASATGNVPDNVQQTIVAPAVAGTYRVQFINTNNPCGAVSEETYVVVTALPNTSYTMDNIVVCDLDKDGKFILSGSEVGVNYQLKTVQENANVGPAVAGTGSAIELPLGNDINPNNPAEYKVVATNPGTGCSQALADKAFVYRIKYFGNEDLTVDNTTVCSGTAFTITGGDAEATASDAHTYEWERSTTSATAGFSTIAGATGKDYTETAGISQSTWYKRIVHFRNTNAPGVGQECVREKVIEIKATSLNTPTLTAPDQICGAGNINYTISGGEQGDKVTYELNGASNTTILGAGGTKTMNLHITADQIIKLTKIENTNCSKDLDISHTTYVRAIPAKPVFTLTPANICGGKGSITITNGQAGDTYSIDYGVSYQASNIFSNLDAGNYLVYIKNSNGCKSPVNQAVVQLDNDCDGVGDMDDKDDDNDGILDTDECAAEVFNFAKNGDDLEATLKGMSVTMSSAGTPNNNGLSLYLSSELQGGGDEYPPADCFGNAGLTEVGQSFLNNGAYFYAQCDGAQCSSATRTFTFAAPTTEPLLLSFTAVEAMNNVKITFTAGEIIKVANGTGVGTQTFTATDLFTNIGQSYSKTAAGFTLMIPAGTSRVSYTLTPPGAPLRTAGYYVALSTACADTDGDGIPNRLDLDSDNDGCVDAIEGDEKVSANMLSADQSINIATQGGIDAQGVPNVVNSGGAADIGGDQGQGIGSSQDAAINVCYIDAKDDVTQTPQNTPVSGNVLTNDDGLDIKVTGLMVDVNGDGTPTAVTPGATTTLTANGGAAIGTIVVNEDGTYTFTPDANYTGEVPDITYTISNSGGTDTAKLKINVIPNTVGGNNPPVANDDYAKVEEGKLAVFNILANDSDVDGDALSVTQVLADTDGDGLADDEITLGSNATVYGTDASGTTEEAGILIVNADGTTTFVPKSNYKGTVPAIYTVSDGKGGTATADIEIEVVQEGATNGINANDDATTGYAGEKMSITPLANDQITTSTIGDNSNLVVQSVTWPDGTTAVQGTAKTIAGTGTFMWNADGTVDFTPEADFVGTVDVPYVAADGTAADANTDKAVMHFTSLGKVEAKDDVTQTPQGETLTGNVLTNDKGSSLTVKSVSVDGANVPLNTPTPINGGTITIKADGSYTFVPADGYTGKVPDIIYTATDDKGNTDTAKLKINVIPDTVPSNNPPVANDDKLKVEAGNTATVNVLSNDSDPDGDALTVTTATLKDGYTIGSGGTTTVSIGSSQDVYKNGNKVGSITVNADGTTTFVPETGFTGTVPVEYTVSDGKGGTATATLDIEVVPAGSTNGVNANDDATTGYAGEKMSITPLANDQITDGSGTLTLKSVTWPDGTPAVKGTAKTIDGTGTFVWNSDGTVDFTPEADFVGTVDVPYVAADGTAADANTDKAVMHFTSLKKASCGFLRSNRNVTRQLK